MRWPSNLLLELFLVGALWTAASAQHTLPRKARDALDVHYPGWRYATVRAALQRGWPAGVSAAWVSGDFDGNGEQDYAASADLDSSSAGDSVVVLPHDGFDILLGEEAGFTCYYVAPEFRCIISGD